MAYVGGVEVVGLVEMVAKLSELEKAIRSDANSELRRGSRVIADEIVAKRGALLGGGGTPQERAFVEGARAKSDRFVAVEVPGVKPALSGLAKVPAPRAKSLAIAIEYGSSWPGLKHPPKGALVGRNMPRISATAYGRYQTLLTGILRKHGLI